MPSHKEIDIRVVATLVRVDLALRNHANRGVQFSMSNELVDRHIIQRDQLASELGLSDDPQKRNRQIQRHRRKLRSADYPWWRVDGHHDPGGNGREAAPGEIIEVRELTRSSA